MELAGDASTERKLDRYLDAEIIIEDLDESSNELHGFLRGIEAAIPARNNQVKEPFRDEFLIRQFIKLATTVQRSLAEGFWEVDQSGRCPDPESHSRPRRAGEKRLGSLA